MSMSKKDYVNIANILRTWEAAETAGVNVKVGNVTESLANYFARDNEQFDRERFAAMARSKSVPQKRKKSSR